MTAALKGRLQGNTITLESTVPPLEGKRVHVLVEPIEEEVVLSAEEQAELLAGVGSQRTPGANLR